MPGYEVVTWSGVIVPAGVPNVIVQRLNKEINTAITSDAAKEKLGSIGYDLVGGSSEQFTRLVRKEIAKWADVVKRTGAKLD